MGLGDWIKNATSGATGGFLKGAADIIGKFVADPTEKAKALAELESKRLQHEENMANIANQAEDIASKERINEDNQVSERWKADMTSDSKLSKNTRPIIVLSLIGFLFVIIITDSITSEWMHFDVKPDYITLLSTLCVTTIVAYFGSKGIEKFKKIHEVKNNK